MDVVFMVNRLVGKRWHADILPIGGKPTRVVNKIFSRRKSHE
jgi:hypothetical protein